MPRRHISPKMFWASAFPEAARRHQPAYCRIKILLDRNAIRKQGIQVPLCGLTVALRGRLEPVVGSTGPARAIYIDSTKLKLRFDMAGLSRTLVPDDGIRNASE